MNMWRPPARRDLSEDARANIARIAVMWTEARTRFGAGGPFLFGRFCAADAMYAPIVSRFETYAIDVSAPVAAYMQAVIALPAWAEWRRAALRETWVIRKFEYDWPDVKRLCGGLPHEARHRQQELFVVVDAAMDRHEPPASRSEEVSCRSARRSAMTIQAAAFRLHAGRDGAGALIDGVPISGRRSRSSNISPRRFPTGGSGRPTPRRGRRRACCRRDACGFAALRRECPINIRRPGASRESPPPRSRTSRASRRCGVKPARHGGPFLFGRFCAADAMYAPVVTRLATYGIKVSRETLGYMETMMALPAFAEHAPRAAPNPGSSPKDEIDWPTVL